MRKMRLAGIIGVSLVLVIAIVLKYFGKNSFIIAPLMLPFAAMILIDLSGRRK